MKASADDSCSFCGHTTRSPFCPRCKARVAPVPSKASYNTRRRGGSSGLQLLRRVIVLAVVVGVGVGVYVNRYRIWYGKDASYALLIRESEQFGKPVNVSVKRGPLRNPLLIAGEAPVKAFGESSSPAACVLEARGLVSFGINTTEETRPSSSSGFQFPDVSPGPNGTVKAVPAPTPPDVLHKVNGVSITLTPQGEKEAAGWTESDASYWRAPIGEREVFGIEKVGEIRNESGAERLDIEFTWQWLPNSLGEAFDTDGPGVASLPHRARAAARELNWGSAKAYRARARLERRAGGEWCVIGIEKSENYVSAKEMSAF